MEGADCDWPRSFGLRVGSVPVPRDGVDAGWIGCGGGLAAAECAAEYGERGELGFDSKWRGGGNWVLAARRASYRCGWHSGNGEANRAGTDERSRDWRSAACGCGLSRGD